jgi:hypothetical protein
MDPLTHASEHVTWAELACHDAAHTPYPEAWRTDRLPILLACFEAIRARCGGKPIEILSAYRTPEHNAAVGGVKLSQHVEGRALDLRPPEDVPLPAFWILVKDLARTLPLRGLGRYDEPGARFVHIDIRPSAITHIWKGNRTAPEGPGAKPHAISE